ncbi:MAG TPA: NAD(P)-dependent oxidoreductase [Blastocatellia bacterium]|nr:NAD(P)-dependent oxidoreductase [Blastocatellia bacterium]
MTTGINELVLGGEGLIGSELVGRLTSLGHEVVSLDLKSGCDLTYVDDRPFRECDRVWFLAWDTGGSKYHSASDRQHSIYKNNCELTARVFDALAKTRKPFLFVTSQFAGQPTAYGMTKWLAEKWAHQLGGKIARLWNTYGWESPGIRSHVVTDLVYSGITEGRVKLLTNGKERRRFIYKSDCVEALIRLFESPKRSADIAGSEWVTIRRLAEEIARQLDVEVEPGVREGEEVMLYPIDILPGWRQSILLSEGVARVIADARMFFELQPHSVGRRVHAYVPA